MSQENIEVVQRVYDAAARRDAAAVLALYTPKIEWDVTHRPPSSPVPLAMSFA